MKELKATIIMEVDLQKQSPLTLKIEDKMLAMFTDIYKQLPVAQLPPRLGA